MVNELRAIADKANEVERAKRTTAIKGYVEKAILAEARKVAELGKYSMPIKEFGGFGIDDIKAVLMEKGFILRRNHYGVYYIEW